MADDDPYASIATPVADDPYAAIATPVQADVQIPRAPAGVLGASTPAVGQVPVPDELRQSGGEISPLDYAKMGRDALLQPEATGTRPGVLGNVATAVHNVGAHAIPAAVAPFVHPLSTLQGAAEMTPPGQAVDSLLGRKNPIEQAAQQFQANPDKPQAAENLAGDVAGSIEGGRLAAGVVGSRPVQAVTNRVGTVATGAKQFIRPATSEAVVPPAQQAASSLAKAINPPGGVPEGLEDSLATQTPGIKDYATRTGNPLNTRWELAKAALGHGQELEDFYDQHVLGPSADRPVPIEGTGYQGETNGNGKATLAQIDKRLSAINKLTRPAFDKASAGATMTALERLGLDNEAGALRQTLYEELAKDTGMTPEAIKKLRTDYGQSYDIAGKTDAARRRVGTGGPVPLTKEGLIQSVLENVVGGRDAIADRGVQSALQQFKPALSPIEAMRRGVTGFRNQAAATAATNQAAAQQEILHGTDLSQDAQAAAAQRAQQAGGVRGQRVAQATNQNRQAANQEVLNAHALDTGAQDSAQERANHAEALRGVHVSGETRYRNGKAFVVDPKSGWWVPK